MGVGFQAFTNNGVFQIDGNTMGFGLRQKIAASTSNSSSGYVWRFYTVISFTAVTPIIAINAPNGVPVSCMGAWPQSGSTWNAVFYSPSQTNFTVYIFDQVASCPPSNSHCGLQVFNGSVQLIADSALGFLRVLDNQQGTMPSASTGSWSWSYGIQTVATACMLNSYQYGSLQFVSKDPDTPGANLGYLNFYTTAWSHSGGTATLNNVYDRTDTFTYTGSGPYSNISHLNWSALQIDVSHL